MVNTKTQRTYDQVFQHPMTHNLEWRDIRAMFEALGTVDVEHNGNLKVTLAGRSVVFQAPGESDVATVEQVTHIRHFLEDAKERDPNISGPHLLVVIDHKEAKVYRTELKGTIPELVLPLDTDGHKTHVHSAHDFMNHTEKPNSDAYFEDVAKSLNGAEKVLIFGSGKGSSGAMDQFVGWLKEHDKAVSESIIGAITIDQGHMTEGQLLAQAREIYSR